MFHNGPAVVPPGVDCRSASPEAAGGAPPYAELHCLSNFSFLRGASHPEELVARAHELGYAALALTDRNSLAGVVRAHLAARQYDLPLIIGAEITPLDAPALVLLAPDRRSYGRLCRLITRGRLRCRKGACDLRFADIAELCCDSGLIALVLPWLSAPEWDPARRGQPQSAATLLSGIARYRAIFGAGDLFLAAELTAGLPDAEQLRNLMALSDTSGVPLVAANAVHYHLPERRPLQDILTCIREKCTIHDAGTRLFANAERHLRPRDEIARRYAACPAAVARTLAIARRCRFSLDELRYDYPHELVPAGQTAMDYLESLTWQGARRRYACPSSLQSQCAPGRALGDGVVPARVTELLRRELALIRELKYEHYFLTVWDLVRFARHRGILCQGRGSAANSAVCYCLGVTAVDPDKHDLLFERFISRERNEPPDIDIDFEHERREEVFQYIYEKYGRERAGITAEVITYRPRSAVRDVGKALGLSLDRLDALAKGLDWWDQPGLPSEAVQAAGLDPADGTVRLLIDLVLQLLGFPRHLSQHVGGFVITESPLCELVPLENGGLPGRTFIEWDKDDIDALGILKVDCLALGMLTAINKTLRLLNTPSAATVACGGAPLHHPPVPACVADVPPDDPAVYDMICAADTVGVFQIESRAQMSMLPRLRPRCFYDLVIEVAIVRPGPIQGGMIHPYLRRRAGAEPVTYPSPEIRQVLGKTLGVPLFQEQVMRLAVVAADFTPGEADQLRRSMAAWRRGGCLEAFQTRLLNGMLAKGYTRDFAEEIYKQIRGFGEYGFPESHAASFALLVYVSAWLKRYHPAAFFAGLLNSQPMGFYAPAQLVRDARRHGVDVRGVDVNHSDWDCTLEAGPQRPALRLGLRLVRGLSEEKVRGVLSVARAGRIISLAQLTQRPDVSRATLLRLAAADAFGSLGLSRRQALWRILALDDADLPLFADMDADATAVELPTMSLAETVVQDYDAIGLSLNAHPIGLLRAELDRAGVKSSAELKNARQGRNMTVAGLVTHRQRPATAKGIVFMTLEDEVGQSNLIVRPPIWEKYQSVARTRIALLAAGRVERQGAVVYLQVQRLDDLSARLARLNARSRDFR